MTTDLRTPGRVAKRLAHYRQRAETLTPGTPAHAEATDYVRYYERLLGAADRCRVCGRSLRDPVSVARGIGPECYGRLAEDGLD